MSRLRKPGKPVCRWQLSPSQATMIFFNVSDTWVACSAKLRLRRENDACFQCIRPPASKKTFNKKTGPRHKDAGDR
jgi:hypothetical protein